mmetsp:Transcript_17388/g.35321  ORF Transcript_17388/g.35321 Transcript_17388/m.35321 type:complete len:360 (-) Transcript_17388:841-1920(-)
MASTLEPDDRKRRPRPRHRSFACGLSRLVSVASMSFWTIQAPASSAPSRPCTKTCPRLRPARPTRVMSALSSSMTLLRISPTSSLPDPAYATPSPSTAAFLMTPFFPSACSCRRARAGSASFLTPLQRIPTPRQAPAFTISSLEYRYLSMAVRPSSTFHIMICPMLAVALSIPWSLFLYSQSASGTVRSLSAQKPALTKPLTNVDARLARAESTLRSPPPPERLKPAVSLRCDLYMSSGFLASTTSRSLPRLRKNSERRSLPMSPFRDSFRSSSKASERVSSASKFTLALPRMQAICLHRSVSSLAASKRAAILPSPPPLFRQTLSASEYMASLSKRPSAASRISALSSSPTYSLVLMR